MKLIGYIDGIEVRFDFYPPHTFKAEIPKQLDGTYTVELKAIDEAGNESNFSNIFIRIDFNKMSFKVLEGFSDKQENSDYSFKEVKDAFDSFILDEAIKDKEILQTYSYRELVI